MGSEKEVVVILNTIVSACDFLTLQISGNIFKEFLIEYENDKEKSESKLQTLGSIISPHPACHRLSAPAPSPNCACSSSCVDELRIR